MGVQIAVDDFGTGYSSLSYLQKLPVDCLKIDQSFVSEITADPHCAPIVSAVISMGKSLNHRVIAEGVENREQLTFLQARRCGEGQGYYFSPPVPAGQFERYVEAAIKAGTGWDSAARAGGCSASSAQTSIASESFSRN
jgi:EAL domain-containing protein (putative c-di-GMP-specific phosphodiesterase class I)